MKLNDISYVMMEEPVKNLLLVLGATDVHVSRSFLGVCFIIFSLMFRVQCQIRFHYVSNECNSNSFRTPCSWLIIKISEFVRVVCGKIWFGSYLGIQIQTINLKKKNDI